MSAAAKPAAKPKPPTTKSYAYQKNSRRVLLDLLAGGPRFLVEIHRITGISVKSVQENLRMLTTERGAVVRCRRVPAPVSMRTGRAATQWQWYRTDTGPLSAAGEAARGAPMKPLQGSGLAGRPIVLRPGSDWALRTTPLVTLCGGLEVEA